MNDAYLNTTVDSISVKPFHTPNGIEQIQSANYPLSGLCHPLWRSGFMIRIEALIWRNQSNSIRTQFMYIPESWINHFSIKHCGNNADEKVAVDWNRLDSGEGDAGYFTRCNLDDPTRCGWGFKWDCGCGWAADEANGFRVWNSDFMKLQSEVRCSKTLNAKSEFHKNLKSSDKPLAIYEAPNKLNNLKTEKFQLITADRTATLMIIGTLMSINEHRN